MQLKACAAEIEPFHDRLVTISGAAGGSPCDLDLCWPPIGTSRAGGAAPRPRCSTGRTCAWRGSPSSPRSPPSPLAAPTTSARLPCRPVCHGAVREVVPDLADVLRAAANVQHRAHRRRRAGRARRVADSDVGCRYPGMVATWERAWERFTPFLAFPAEVPRIIYTTNAIESLNYPLRKITRIVGTSRNDDAPW